MSLPDKLSIARMEDLHSNYLGETADGQLFWGYETFVFTKPMAEIPSGDWAMFRRDFAIVHLFDADGNYLESKYHVADFSPERDMEELLENLVSGLGDVTYRGISIRLFTTRIEGFLFGLVPNQTQTSIELQPNSMISFQAPWDGEYYT